MIDWNTVIREAHKTAVEKGWWDRPVTVESQICNLHCELSEAWQEYRNGHAIDEIYCAVARCQNALMCKERCLEYHPQGIPIELADFCLRVCDWMGKKGIEYPQHDKYTWVECYTFEWFIEELHGVLEGENFPLDEASYILDSVSINCEKMGIPLEDAIRQKMEYNRTRPWRHGGKRV